LGTQQTLDELKVENATEREANKAPVKDLSKNEYIEVDPETDEPIVKDDDEVEDDTDEVTLDDIDDTDDTDSDDDDDDSGKPEALEDWQKSEEEEVSKDGKKTGFVPNAGAAKLRHKLKDAKAVNKEQTSRMDELEAEIAQLKVSSTPLKTEDVLPPRPKMDDPDIDYDQDKYDQKMDTWQDLRVDRKINSHTDSLQKNRLEEAQHQAKIQKTDKAVTGHLERAADLIGEGKITEDKWLAGDMKIRQSLESFLPNAGDALADQFITLLNENGTDSEKVWYYIGNNAKALAEFTSKVVSDPTGALAVMYLSRVQDKFSSSVNKKRSGAPKPATKLKGDKGSGSGGKMKKQYDAAQGDPQTRIDLKQAAKKKGIDVTLWK